MTHKDTVYTVMMGEQPYWFEQNCFFCEDGDVYGRAVNLYAHYKDDFGVRRRRLISGLTFREACDLKETVDEIIENLLPRCCGANPDRARDLLRDYPWLKEKAGVNQLFGSGEKHEEE